MVLTDKEARKYKVTLDSQAITSLQPGDTFYLDLRVYGWQWYAELNLPELDLRTYVTECRATTLGSRGRKIYIKDLTYGDEFFFRNYDVVAHCYRRKLDTADVLVDKAFTKKFPHVLFRG